MAAQTCPKCSKTFQVPDWMTGTAKCPHCAGSAPDSGGSSTVQPQPAGGITSNPTPQMQPGSVGPSAKPEGATSIFVLGLLGLVICNILGIFAWVKGNGYMAKCRQLGVEPEGLAVAGRILGMIATILILIGLGICVLAIIASAIQ